MTFNIFPLRMFFFLLSPHDFSGFECMSNRGCFSGIRLARSLVCCLVFGGSLFVYFSFFFWPLCYMSYSYPSRAPVFTLIDRQLNMKHHEFHVNPRVISRASEG